jgi:hypothetical protein
MELDPIDEDTMLCRDDLPWNDIGMMLYLGEENCISLHKVS